MLEFLNNLWGLRPSINRVVLLARLSTLAGRSDTRESILELRKSLKIRALLSPAMLPSPNHRVHTEWQCPLYGERAERAVILPLFLLYPYMYSVNQTVPIPREDTFSRY